MKKPKPPSDEMRAEYRREDLGPLVRGKYAARYAKATNVVVIDPALTKGGLKSEVQHLAPGKVPRCNPELRTDSFSLKNA